MSKKSRYAVLATVLAFVASVMAAPSAAAAYPVDVQCWGDKVIRCVRLDVSGGVSAAASITDDQSDSANYDVSVTTVHLFEVWNSNGGEDRALIGSAESPGWNVEWDRAETSKVPCISGTSYRVAASFHWQPTGTAADDDTVEARWSAKYTCP